MAKSLNQAFIKAYSKEKTAVANRQAAAEANLAADANARLQEFVMRFDTSTVLVPPPHIAKSGKPRHEVGAGVSASSKPSQRSNVESSSGESAHASAPSAKPELEIDPLRSSIAAQMLQASGWQDQPIDAFVGGFPMHSPARAQVPVPPPKRSVASPNTASAQATAGEGDTFVRETSIRDSVIAAQLPSVGSGDASGSDASGSDAPELSAPEAPALSLSNVESALVERQSSRRQGEIFRLDRPTYSRAASVESLPDEPEQDSGEQSSVIGGLNTNGLDIRFDPKATSPQSPSPQSQMAREAEVNLREARQRIFNPVWEVDCFQWPAVCRELLAGRKAELDRVAKNLVASCTEGLQILAVTSTQSGAGRTTVACCLAMLAGSHGLNVAIVDGDIENPTLSVKTNLDVEFDWKSALLDEIPIEEVAIHSINDQVTLVPLLSPLDQAEMASDDKRIANMLQELAESFDLVIVDTGHMDSTRNLVMTMGEHGLISAVVAVVDNRTSSAPLVEACIRRIRRAGIASVGLVENFAA